MYIVSRKGLSDKVTFGQRGRQLKSGGSCAVPEERVFHANGMAGTKVLETDGRTGQISAAGAERAIASDQPPTGLELVLVRTARKAFRRETSAFCFLKCFTSFDLRIKMSG